MKRLSILGVLALLLGAGAILLLRAEHRPQPPAEPTAVEATPPVEHEARPGATPAPIRPPDSAPAGSGPQRKILGPSGPIPAGAHVALPAGTGPDGGLIRAQPRAATEVRDHAHETPAASPRAFTPEGLGRASKSLRDALADCFPKGAAAQLQFTLTTTGGKAQARDPHVVGAAADAPTQQCVAQALGSLSWDSSDHDGADPVTMPLRFPK